MDKIDRIIQAVRFIKEEGGMVANASGSGGGFGGSSDPKGPTAGFDPVMGKVKKRYASLGIGSRKRWMKPKS